MARAANPERGGGPCPRALRRRSGSRVISLVPESTRRYPEGSLAAAVLGYVGTDDRGLGGLEYRYDSEVRGKPVTVTLLKDAAQRPYAVRTRAGGEAPAEGIEGASLRLTLRLAGPARGRARARARRGGVPPEGRLRDRPRPGDGRRPRARLVAAFRPEPFRRRGRRTRAVPAARPTPTSRARRSRSWRQAPRSTAARSALDDPVDCGGGTLTIGSTTIHEHGGKGWSALTIGDILAHSSNIGIAHVALGLGRGPVLQGGAELRFRREDGRRARGRDGRPPEGHRAAGARSRSRRWRSGRRSASRSSRWRARTRRSRTAASCRTLHLVEGRETERFCGHVSEHPAARAAPRPERGDGTRRCDASSRGSSRWEREKPPPFRVTPPPARRAPRRRRSPAPGTRRRSTSRRSSASCRPTRPRVVIAVVVDEPHGKTYGGDVAAPVFSLLGGEVLRVLRVAPRRPDGARSPILTADLSAGAAAAASARAQLAAAGVVPAANRSGAEARRGRRAGSLGQERARRGAGPRGPRRSARA